jgi:hypothetical protein
MALQVRSFGSRLLLILALAAALLAGLVAVGWAMGQAHGVGVSSQPQYMAPVCSGSPWCLKTSSVGGDNGGGKLRAGVPGGDSGGGHLRTGPIGNDSGGGH